MRARKNLYPIPITWEKLYNEIFCIFAENPADYSPEEFLRLFIPETVCDRVFPRKISDDGRISEFFCGSKDAKDEFLFLRDWIIDVSSRDEKAKTYKSCPVIKSFRKEWESLVPICKFISLANLDKTREIRDELKEAIIEILTAIPWDCDPLRIESSLSPLMDDGKYSLVLGIMSAIASTLSCFGTDTNHTTSEDRKLIDIVLPCLEKTDGEMGGTRLESNLIQITWKRLHKEIYLSNAEGPVNAEFNKFLRDVFPKELFSVMFSTGSGNNRREGNQKYTGNVYSAKNGAKSRFEAARDYIIGMRTSSGEAYTWNTSPVIQQFQENWERLLPASAYSVFQLGEIPEDTRASANKLQKNINNMLRSISQESLNISARLTSLCKKEPYSKVLAILSVIASTLFCFGLGEGDLSDRDRELHSVVLPLVTERVNSRVLREARKQLPDAAQSLAVYKASLESALKDPSEMGEAYYLLYQKALQQSRQADAENYLRRSVAAGYPCAVQMYYEKEAHQLLSKANEIFHDSARLSRSAKECCEKCIQLLNLPSYVPQDCKGEASYILYKCINSGTYTPRTGETARYYLKISFSCGYPAAIEDWKELDDSTITPKITRSSAESTGVCYSNANNPISAIFKKTIPDSWGGSFQPFDLETESRRMLSGIHCRFLLVDDSFRKNAEDFFRLLQLVKTHHNEAISVKWEIFLRHDSDSVRALVDTALSQLPNVSIPVYILNDNKIAAQQLLSQHPLFFPVRSINVAKKPEAEGSKPLLHFVVVGTSDAAQWLVREAFWMMGFRNNAIETQITILAENAEAFESQIKGRYPGMTKSQISIQGVALPVVHGKDIDLFSQNFTKEIAEITSQTSYCYFAVATDSDDTNLSLATRLRETLIRRAITNKQEESLRQQPPIAFLCRNNQTAWLSRSLVIETETHGDRWYNTWALIPFGEYSARYTFDEIAGGTFDTLAKSIHYQYSQVSPSDAINCTSKAQDVAREYYRRQYNQDSSYSMALSMPYRLFQFQDAYGIQICPPGWSILETTVYSSVIHLKNLASRLITNPSEQEIQEIAEWEHGRWIRWMLSRGWLPLSFEEAVFAYKCGNPRQQLFVSKQHPCICSYGDLKKLQEVLKVNCDISKDFYTFDLSNIRDTRRLLSLEWIAEQDKESER